MYDLAAPAALIVAFIGAAAGRLVDAATDPNGGPVPQYLTQLGVTGACLAIAWFMLKRSDSREAKVVEKEAAAQRAQVESLQRELEFERRQREHAESRAQDLLARLVGEFHPRPDASQ